MLLGMEVGLGPGHIMVDGDPAPLSKKGGTAPNFRPMSIVAKRSRAAQTRLSICTFWSAITANFTDF